MPLSHPWSYPVVLHHAMAINPSRILDVGIGIGAYGMLLRQHLDIAEERVPREDWQVAIHGIELFEPYRNPLWDYFYDQVTVGDVRNLLPNLPQYDLILCADVLEHFPLVEAALLAQRFLDHAPVVIATTPNFHCPQGAWGGNEAETHHCRIGEKDLPHVAVTRRTGATDCFILSKDAATAEFVRKADRLCHNIVNARHLDKGRRLSRRIRNILASLAGGQR